MAGFHPDPSVCRAGDTYWMVCSSFEYAPGVPLFRSPDLLTWEQAGNVLSRPSQLTIDGTPSSAGIYAPTIRFHDGRFWVITTNVWDGQGQLLTWATDPAGEWSDPIRFPDVPGIDPDLAWDDDGTCYLTVSGGPEGIFQYVINPSTGEVLSERQRLWSGTGGQFPEAPHLYHVDGHWYLMIAEGGTERGHAVTIARGPSPAGPFEPGPDNPVLTARSTDLPVQNTGHGDLVQRPDGSWAMLYHGVRTRGFTPAWHVLGRETFASDIAWVDGWPRLTTPIEPAEPATVKHHELTGDTLPASWVSPGRFPGEILHRDDDGWRLDGPGFAGRRQQHLAAEMTATLDVRHGTGGLSIQLSPRHRLDIEADTGQVRAIGHSAGLTATLGQAPISEPSRVRLTLRAVPVSPYAGPDEIIAELITETGPVELGRLDGRHLSTEIAGGFTGRIIGITATNGHIGIRSLTYTGTDQPQTR
ncbi:glycoside hydrolase family 43 protein [Actinoplanes couchii]|uniref:Glycoside hydrolase 43 family protein n=1 Tax=Actinoplanes couchii TaxID=403638 RepID=A0ABQ3XS02_9ACTN|nr:glycoside hydrolase 43 family protein [Actinoplanes couchii]